MASLVTSERLAPRQTVAGSLTLTPLPLGERLALKQTVAGSLALTPPPSGERPARGQAWSFEDERSSLTKGRVAAGRTWGRGLEERGRDSCGQDSPSVVQRNLWTSDELCDRLFNDTLSKVVAEASNACASQKRTRGPWADRGPNGALDPG